MRIPIRMIGVATTIFWIFLIIFVVSAVYSAKDLHLEFGEPQMSLTEQNELILRLPMTVGNAGFYNIGSFVMTTGIFDEDGSMIAGNSTYISVIRRGDQVTATHVMTINVSDLLQSDQNFLFNDSELEMDLAVSMRIAEMIPVKISTSLSVPWGAPLYNFTLGEPEPAAIDPTNLRVNVPMSFDNHAFFDVTGAVQVRMYNDAGKLIGEGQTLIEVPQGSSYNGYVEFNVFAREMTRSGSFEVYFETPLFSYGPVVFPYG